MNQSAERKPAIVGWEITNACNLHCPHCYNPISKPNELELTTAECMPLIDSVAELGAEAIGWTGGEPLLRQDLEQLIAYAYDKHQLKSGITTNGVLLDKERGKSLKKAGAASIQISLDGTTPERSWQIRRTTDEEYEKVIAAIRVCRELEIKANLAMLLGLENLDDAREMLKLARREGVGAIRFCGFTPEGRAKNDTISKRFAFGDRLAELHEFVDLATADDVVAMFDPGFGPVPPHYWFHECVAGVQTLYIKANGDVFPCTSLLYDRFLVGNVRDRTLADIWNDPAMSNFTTCAPDEIEGTCANCDNFDDCHGACRGLAYAHTGSFKASFPNCLYQVSSTISSSHNEGD